MTTIEPAACWFEIIEVPTFDLDEVMGGNDEYIDKSSARASQLFNNICLFRYPRPRKVVFDNGYELKRDFNPLLKDFDIDLVLTTIKNSQDNAPVERVYKEILNMLVTKYLHNTVFDYIYLWDENISYIAR